VIGCVNGELRCAMLGMIRRRRRVVVDVHVVLASGAIWRAQRGLVHGGRGTGRCWLRGVASLFGAGYFSLRATAFGRCPRRRGTN
jgi:hypothetical protein